MTQARVMKASELTIRDYVASLNLNPENVYYQRVRSNNVTTAGAQWQITSPNKRSLLLSYANVEWLPTIQRQSIAGAPDAFPSSGDKFSFKPILPFTNAMTSQTVSMNGNSLTIAQPRRFSELLSRLCVGKGESRACYESEWWDGVGGLYSANRAGIDARAAQIDEGLWNNENAVITKLQETQTDGRLPGATYTGNNDTIPYEEPLYCPPFNPYAKVQSGTPTYMPFKNMSPMIPNIDRVEVDIQFNSAKLAAGVFYYRYGHLPVNAGQQLRIEITALAANLHLYWYEVPVNMSIPRAPVLQTWNIREFQEQIDAAVAIPNGRNAENTANTSLLQLRSVPALILIHGRRRQDVDTYLCASHVSDADFNGTTPGGAATATGGADDPVNHSLDTYAEILSMNVLLGDRPNVISTTFTQRQLYELTLKNAKYLDYSLSFQDWRGRMVGQYDFKTDGDPDVGPEEQGTLQPQMSKAFVAFQPKDLAERISGGVFFPNSLQVEVNFRAKDGAAGLEGSDHIYDIFTHVIVGKHWLRIEPDRGQYQEQNVPLEAAERELRAASSTPLPVSGGYVSRF